MSLDVTEANYAGEKNLEGLVGFVASVVVLTGCEVGKTSSRLWQAGTARGKSLA